MTTVQTLRFARMTKERAGKLRLDLAMLLVGPWWSGNDGVRRLDMGEDGRQQIHRVWLRYTFNSDASLIPDDVLESHAIGEIREMAHCWFARELAKRRASRARGSYDCLLFEWGEKWAHVSPQFRGHQFVVPTFGMAEPGVDFIHISPV